MTEYIVVITEQGIHYGGVGNVVFITTAANRSSALAAVRVYMHEESPNRQAYYEVVREKIFTKKEYLEHVLDKAKWV